MSVQNPALMDGAIIDRGYLASVLAPRRAMIVTFTLIGMVLFGALGFWLKPTYRGEAMLVAGGPDQHDLEGIMGSTLSSVGELASLAGLSGLSSSDQALEESLAVLQSKEFNEDYIAKHDLLPILFAKQWDPNTHSWKVPPGKQPTLNKGFRVFEHLRDIHRDKLTGIITLRIDWKDRYQAVEWVNGLVAALNSEMQARAIAEADASLGYLQKALVTTSEVNTREAINRLIESQVKKRMIATVTQEYALRFVDHALVPDMDDPVGPRKLVLIAVGLVLGFLGSTALALLLDALKPSRRV